ncbi:PEP-CTERM sorting domain-containing protein [Zoogloea sp.]|uniref:PEP-CTERM sorting domain-containing protein n=1 Tax=Zoogloea sp. TaxID=49181 RepID=UPI00260D7C23|nr:PEP-CTERM sorting domain-containing protein [Zoogloea sp.]MDD3353281.1 PEP-CTERM sorting domain-containing protein [Zoogloea sp.]
MKHAKNLLAGLLLAAFGNAHAALVNGTFDTDLSGWSALGDVAVVNGSAVLTTASLEDDDGAGPAARNLSGTAAALVGVPGGLESFAGLPLGALDLNSWSFEGSALRQTLTVAAGDTLSFAWDFSSLDTFMNDFAFVMVDGQVNVLAHVLGGTGSGLFSQTFLNGGSFDLVFGVADEGDYVGTSFLSIDQVSLRSAASSVPEPTSLALGLGALGLLAALRRKG